MGKTFTRFMLIFLAGVSGVSPSVAAVPQNPTPARNGVYVPEYTGTLKLAPGTKLLTPLQTELVGPLDISRVHLGSPVLAKLDVAWSGPGCKLRANSILAGHIAEIEPRTKQNHISRVTVLFDTADCDGAHSVPYPTSLVAVLAGTLGGDQNLAEGPALADAIGLTAGSTSSASTPGSNGLMRSAMQASAITDYSPLPVRKLPSQVLSGQVIGLSQIRLSVNTGLNGGSVLSAPNHDLRLESSTHLILMPRSAPPSTDAADTSSKSMPSGSTPSAMAAILPTPETVDETDVCSSACTTITGIDFSTPTTTKAGGLSVTNLGYMPKEKREITSFGYDAALTYLDGQNLLFTFDPHKLRERGGGVLQEFTRSVRAVLIDPASQQVKRILDWRVEGEGRYIWRVGPDKLLVHVGHQLRLFGPDLASIRSVSVPGPLAWISAAPSGNHFAVGIYRERHTADVHRELIEATGDEPEEDIEVRVYDENLNLLLTAPRSAESYQPVLSDLGEIRVRSIGHAHWQISEYRWDHTEHNIARTTSYCRPRISAALSGYLFIVGCDSTPGTRWYRMIGPDGHPVLRAFSPSEEIEQTCSSITSDEFAVRVVRLTTPLAFGQTFRKTDIQHEEVNVYRTSDGRRLFSTAAAEVPLSEQSFALSPNGSQLALIGDSSINFYPINSKLLP
jgi:hypothetical protein